MRTPLLVLAAATVVMGAWAAAAQTDLKRVFAYSSVNHLGYCLLGIFALAVPAAGAAAQASQAAALNGVILQMFNHGLTAAALFWFISMIQFRSGGLRGINDFGGLRKPAPVFAGLMGIALFSSLGLPGLNGFVGEFLIFRGVFPLSWISATVSVLGLLVTAVVILTVIQKVFTGPVPEHWATFPDLHHGERHGSRAGHRAHVPARPCAPAHREHHQSHGPEPAGALEILEDGPGCIYISFAGALIAALLPKDKPVLARWFALGVAVAGLRHRRRGLRCGLWAGRARCLSTRCGCLPWASTTCSLPTASAACWFCSPASPRWRAFSSVGTSNSAPISFSLFISRSSAASTASF